MARKTSYSVAFTQLPVCSAMQRPFNFMQSYLSITGFISQTTGESLLVPMSKKCFAMFSSSSFRVSGLALQKSLIYLELIFLHRMEQGSSLAFLTWNSFPAPNGVFSPMYISDTFVKT